MPETGESKSQSSHFYHDILTLVTGTTLAHIIVILAYPVITRLYGPAAFGLLALFTSITGLLITIACFRYEFAIMLPKTDEEAANIFGLCIIIVLFFSLISLPFLFVLHQPIIQFLKAPQLEPYLWLVSPMILIGGIFATLNYWNTRTKKFYRLSISRVVSSASSTGTQLGAGVFGYASGGVLIEASILGQIVGSLTLGIQIIWDHYSFFKQNISLKGIISVSRKYCNFPKYDITSTLLNSLSWQLPIFLLSYFFSTTIVGYYSLGMMMIQLPMSLIGGAITQVFFQRAAEAKNEGSLTPLVENFANLLIKIGIFPMITLSLVGKDIFIIFFGEQWAEAGVFVQILSIWAFCWFISSPLSSIIDVLQKQSWNMKYNLFIFVTRFFSLVIGGLLNNVYLALILFSSTGFIVYGFLCVKLLEFTNVSMTSVIRTMKSEIVRCSPMIIVMLLMVILNLHPIVIVIASIGLGLIYYFYLVKNDPTINCFAAGILTKQK